jgi:murein L,D-transpeptidase YcbB/YkuD
MYFDSQNDIICMKGKKIRPPFFACFMAACCFFMACKHHVKMKNGKPVEITEKTILIDAVQAQKYLNTAPDRLEFGTEISKFYKDNNSLMAWDEYEKPGGLAEKFITKLQTAHEDGLDTIDFRVSAIRTLLTKSRSSLDRDSSKKDLDILLTTEFIRYAAQMREGITRQRKKELGWVVHTTPISGDSILKTVMAGGDNKNAFLILDPPHPEYLMLRTALKSYRDAEKQNAWQPLKGFAKLKEGDVSDNVTKLREALAIEGDYNMGQSNFFNPKIFDLNLQLSVKAFQTRHGIDPNGIVAGKTLDALNVPIHDRIKQILLNMERWRMVPPFTDRYLLVNVPEFKLHVYDGGKEVIQMRTVVGKEFKSTPVFNDNMRNIVFSPYWNIPNSITESDVLPAYHRNPDFINKNHMEAVDGFDTGAHVVPFWTVKWSEINDPGFHYRLRQRPGDNNPLGLVKFMFPNNFNVYLHGTSSPGLFNKVVRTYSHGCIRVEDPVKLAGFLLSDQPEWTPDSISAAMKRGKEEWVSIKATPVFILYFTSWVDADGKMQFRDDIYGLDKAMGGAMNF